MKHDSVEGNEKRRRVHEAQGLWGGMPTGTKDPADNEESLRGDVGCQGEEQGGESLEEAPRGEKTSEE